MPFEQDRAAAHEDHRDRAQLQLPFPQGAQQVGNKFLGAPLHHRDSLLHSLDGPAQKNGVNFLLRQEDVLGRPDFGDDLVVEHDDAVFQRVAGNQVAPALFDLNVVQCVASDVHHQRQRDSGEGLEHGDRRRVGLRVAGHIVDQNRIGLAAVGEADHAPPGEILDKFFALRPVVRRRQAHRQLHPNDAGDVGAGGLDFLGDSEQGEDKEAVILRLVPAIGDALVGDLIVFVLVFQHI